MRCLLTAVGRVEQVMVRVMVVTSERVMMTQVVKMTEFVTVIGWWRVLVFSQTK
jgi:hypothetical protein